MRRTVIAQTASEIGRLRYFWEKLPAPTIFQSFAWNYAAARLFVDRERPHVVYVESDSGAGLIPAATKGDRLTLMGEEMFDYRDVLVAGDQGVLESGWLRASQTGLDFSAGALRGDANLSGFEGFHLSTFYGAPMVSRREISPELFAARHNRLGRWKRRLERERVELKCHTGSNRELVRRIYEEKGRQPAENGDSLFGDPLRVEFMVQVCAAMGASCEIFTWETAGTLVASLVTFREPHARRFYTVQFDTAWAKYSPGMVLIYEVTQRSLKAGLDCDYMTGEHEYKMRFATSVVPMYWVEASAERLRLLEQKPLPLAA